MVEGTLGGGVINAVFGPQGRVTIAYLRRNPHPNGEGVSL